ncbi:MAG: ankyrin repeat domain-containing protein [Candidatus Thiodiazotropha sp. (ex Lucinoma kastoroae)]|nr:ankyrin repeat domain-containing protein [Candidatus Thiodiazotropha sp. (ex Lucinoma kastoroae)]
MTPLLHAVESENIRLIELLVGLGADINKKGHEGFTPLHLAVDISIDGTIQTGGKPGGKPGDEPLAIISFLISNGADVTSKTDKGDTPIDIAKAYRAHKVIEYLNEAKP